MAIPPVSQFRIPLLTLLGDGKSRHLQEAVGDGCIDGVINEDRLGLDAVYVQAKRWKNTVGVNELRNFVGALSAQKAQINPQLNVDPECG